MTALRTRIATGIVAGAAVLAMTAAAPGPAALAGQAPAAGETGAGPGTGPGMMGDMGMTGMAPMGRPWITIMLDHRRELGLTAEQVGKLFDLREGFQQFAQERSQELARAEDELAALLGPKPVDLAAVEAKLKAAERMRTELRLARLKTIEEGKRLLTPEQQAKLVQLAERLPSTGTGAMTPERPQ